jgi:hypothetical protein
MGLDITDDEEETMDNTKKIENINGEYVLMDVKDEKLAKKEVEWKKKIINHVKTKPVNKKSNKLKQES